MNDMVIIVLFYTIGLHITRREMIQFLYTLNLCNDEEKLNAYIQQALVRKDRVQKSQKKIAGINVADKSGR